MAIDVGTKTLGLAVSDEEGVVAFPLETVRRTNKNADVEALRRVIDERDVQQVVVGLPLNMDGTPGAMSASATWFADQLEQQGCAVTRWDERLSTVEAERVLLQADVSRRKRKKVIDKLAATVILQAFLDSRSFGRES